MRNSRSFDLANTLDPCPPLSGISNYPSDKVLQTCSLSKNFNKS